ncbi:MAG: GTP 3',8-cyclase MoaA [Myxococcota bacterium]
MIPSLYLRLSVTDHCNLHCAYCRPERRDGASDAAERLSCDEIVRAAVLANDVIPLRKLRLTGGEPLLRTDIVEIVRTARASLPRTTLCLTTNGLRLAALAAPLYEAGVRALNVSLDTTDADVFRALTGAAALHRVVQGIQAASEIGFDRFKLNAVLLKGCSEEQILPLVQLACESGAEMRFIELMPSGAGSVMHPGRYLPAAEALERLKRELHYEGCLGRTGTAARHRFRDGDRIVTVGFITPVSEPFCAGCDRLRLDSRGCLYGCLHSAHRISLAPWLAGGDDEAVRDAYSWMLSRKAGLARRWSRKPMVAIGG